MAKIGNYYYTSWGYDQTNIDYIVVVGVSDSGETAKCQRASHINIGSQGTDDLLMPGTAEGPTFTMRIQGERLRGSYPYIWNLWEARRLDSFLPIRLGDIKAQTMAQFGH